MNNINFRGIIRTFFLVVIILLPAITSTSCNSDDDDQPRFYTIGISSTSISSSSTSYLSILQKAEEQYDSSFTLTGSQENCDIQAKAKFTAAMAILRAAAAQITDCSGHIIYSLTHNGEEITSEQINFEKL